MKETMALFLCLPPAPGKRIRLGKTVYEVVDREKGKTGWKVTVRKVK